ncbi:hypothetical protein O0S10_08115 [Methanocorpusculum sp. MG]|uniref:Uncharacterized protein n=1 Tax=Methanocorpusculum petauri TaxID=3002863 RepID=A0ABT4IJC2_9EURY|nr:hypothetical protein [Methanocorpusculum petauri]MCZ0861183.1 hypothetical protein [Methanocorpusculum petauri]
MAVQSKSNAGDKPRQKKNINWTQVGVVAFCVLLVVMCIISFSNLGNIFNQNGGTTTSGTLVAGDLAYVDYTMYIGDVPMVTSSLDVFNNSPADRLPTWTQTLGLVAGQQMDVVNGTPLLINSSYEYPFRMLNQEYNQIATGVVGLAVGESRTVESTGSFFQTTYTKDQAEEMGIDYANWTVGTMGLMNFPVVNETSNTTTMAIRPALVTNKTADEMVLQYGYDTIEMKVVQAYRTNA